jgi:hypothetical protein
MRIYVEDIRIYVEDIRKYMLKIIKIINTTYCLEVLNFYEDSYRFILDFCRYLHYLLIRIFHPL